METLSDGGAGFLERPTHSFLAATVREWSAAGETTARLRSRLVRSGSRPTTPAVTAAKQSAPAVAVSSVRPSVPAVGLTAARTAPAWLRDHVPHWPARVWDADGATFGTTEPGRRSSEARPWGWVAAGWPKAAACNAKVTNSRCPTRDGSMTAPSFSVARARSSASGAATSPAGRCSTSSPPLTPPRRRRL